METHRNIVLITIDSLRADHCSFMGYERETTPNMDKMAREGILFKNAVAPASRTLPSMTSIFTGDLITEYVKCDSEKKFVENAKRNLKRKETLAEKLSREGYSTGAFNPNPYASRYFGFNKGFDFFEDFLFKESSFRRVLGKGKLTRILNNLLDLIENDGIFKSLSGYYEDVIHWVNNTKEPFFLWLFLLDTHFPFLTPRKHRKWSSKTDIQLLINYKFFNALGKSGVEFTESERNKIINAYDDSIRFADHYLGKLVNELMEFDPIIVITADHGEEFGERDGIYGHGHYVTRLYQANIHVPLIIYNAGMQEVIEKPYSLIDLPKTIEGLAKGEEGPIKLRDFVISKDFKRDAKEIFSVILNDWKFITGQKGVGELYYLKRDPYEQENLIDEHPDLVKEMRQIVEKHIKQEEEKKRLGEKISRLKI